MSAAPSAPTSSPSGRISSGKYAKLLVEKGGAYYCFCQKSDDGTAPEGDAAVAKHTCGCPQLSPAEIQEKLQSGAPYVIRQKIPRTGATTFHDITFGDITVENTEMEDQVLHEVRRSADL